MLRESEKNDVQAARFFKVLIMNQMLPGVELYYTKLGKYALARKDYIINEFKNEDEVKKSMALRFF
jgi:hypothetical protein